MLALWKVTGISFKKSDIFQKSETLLSKFSVSECVEEKFMKEVASLVKKKNWGFDARDNRELKIPRRRRRQKHRLKSDSSIYETLARLYQLGHYVFCKRTLPELNS